jgi:TPR repeat protein
MFSEGRGVAQSDVEAARWCRKAADQGYADAQHNLGFMFSRGRGVAQSDVKAVRWYRKAADQGHANAQHELENMNAV